MKNLLFIWVLGLATLSFSLVLEESVEVGSLVELNSEASIWLRCEASSPCESNIKAGEFARISQYIAPKLVLEFRDGTQAWLKATADGFEGMYPTSYKDFPPIINPEEDSVLIAQKQVFQHDQDSIAQEIQKCKTLKGPKFEGIGFGCQQSIVKTQLQLMSLKNTSLSDSRIGLIAYKLKGKVLNVQLVFNQNNRFSGVEYHFDLENQRKFKSVVTPQLKWLSQLFTQGLGPAAETFPLKTRSLREDQTKPYQKWDKSSYVVEIVFGKTDGMINAMGFIKNESLYLERKGQDVLNLDPKEAMVTEDDFGDFEVTTPSKKATKAMPQVGSKEVPEDFDDW